MSGFELFPPRCSLSAKAHSNERDSPGGRYLFKIKDFFDGDQPINEIITLKTSVKFRYVYFETLFPATVDDIPLS